MNDEIDNDANDNVPDSVEPEPTEPLEPEPTEPLEPELAEPLEQETDRPAVAAESEPRELQEAPDHEETGMEPVPAEGVGVERRQPAELVEPPPTCENAGSTSHSEGVLTPPSRQAPVSWIGWLRARSSRKRPSRFED